jgi:lia operon protein LiaG
VVNNVTGESKMDNFNIKKTSKIALLLVVISIGFSLISAKIHGTSMFESYKGASSISGEGSIDEIKEFDINSISKVFVDTVSSDINIILSKDNNIKIHFHGTTSEMSGAPKLETSQSGDELEISIKYPKQIMSLFNFSLDTKLDIYIPESYKKSMSIETVSGEVSIDKVQTENFKVHTTSGDVDIKSLVANITDFNSVSGSINIKDLSSKSSGFKTTSGDIKIEAITGDIKARSVSGSIKALYKEFNNDIDAETVSGDVDLNLPQDSQFKVDFSTTSGELDNDFPIVMTGKVDKRDIKGTVGNGEKTIRIKTVSGDAAINKK